MQKQNKIILSTLTIYFKNKRLVIKSQCQVLKGSHHYLFLSTFLLHIVLGSQMEANQELLFRDST